ncbi:MAG: Fic family protein [bacterium]|nr:Fic family protein [bacterium]
MKRDTVRPQLSTRQEALLGSLRQLGVANNKTLLESIRRRESISRVTLIRDLHQLIKTGLVKKHGRGRGVFYQAETGVLLRELDPGSYFEQGPDQRVIQPQRFQFEGRQMWDQIFSVDELKHFGQLTDIFRQHLDVFTESAVKRELERITIEFSWKSSRIEGSTYTLLDTERLLKEHREAPGKTREEAVMILNHTIAFEYIWSHPKHFLQLSLKKIEEIHDLIAKDLGIEKGIRKRPVGIVGTVYRPHDNQYQIREAVSDLCKLINGFENPFLKALVGVVGLSYIQPFADGNKRTSRLVGNALLIAFGCCPLSYRSVDEGLYKKAIILFYEQHSLAPFRQLFAEQVEFAAGNYFL